MLFGWLLVPAVFVSNLGVCGPAKLTAVAVAFRAVVWAELVNAVSSGNSYLLFMLLLRLGFSYGTYIWFSFIQACLSIQVKLLI